MNLEDFKDKFRGLSKQKLQQYVKEVEEELNGFREKKKRHEEAIESLGVEIIVKQLYLTQVKKVLEEKRDESGTTE